jgi:hypothetical protein
MLGGLPSVTKNCTGLITRKTGLNSNNIFFDSGTMEYGYIIGIVQYTMLKTKFNNCGISRIYGVKKANRIELLITQMIKGNTKIGTRTIDRLNFSGYKIMKAVYIAKKEYSKV